MLTADMDDLVIQSWWVLLLLCLMVGLLAGFIDSIAGGGGLITVPVMLLLGLPPHAALGTSKGQAVFGSGTALWRYAQSPLLDRSRIKPALFPALVGSALGVGAVHLLNPKVLTPIIVVMLMLVALFLLFHPTAHVPNRPSRKRSDKVVAAVALAIAFYDGFLGPGTGTFLILAYLLLWHDPMDAASANAKVVNFGSNLAAVIIFALLGSIRWQIALPMGLGQSLGAMLGAHVTIRRGPGLVRVMVITISLLLVLRLAYGL